MRYTSGCVWTYGGFEILFQRAVKKMSVVVSVNASNCRILHFFTASVKRELT